MPERDSMQHNLIDKEAIFKVACKIESPKARDAYLKQICDDDHALLERVVILLQVNDEQSRFLEEPPHAFGATLDSPRASARFEAERQALAIMNHPNIAKVLDVGTTEEGRPYFVMELVKGIPISKYCDKNKLDTGQRLDLFITVYRAVQHAHQKGIIHRDLKPSNVLGTVPK
jgi:serine/threonine protein kinase